MDPTKKPPVAVVCIGMAGSGKTTFMRRINAHLHSQKDVPYLINLDPAVLNVPFESNIDIRDAVNYEEVMRQYNLGPNGGILTALNLFATKVDQVVGLLEKRAAVGVDVQVTEEKKESEEKTEEKTGEKTEEKTGEKTEEKTEEKIEEKTEEKEESKEKESAQEKADIKNVPLKHILVDTPGQIEVFVWSASGTILLESLASSFPTVIAYVIDTPRTTSTSTFVSNMLYACSILYKTKLPMILVFNKTDVKDAAFAKEWMTDYDAFEEAHMRDQAGSEHDGGQGGTYMGSLVNSMGLMLQEFYSHLSVVGVSSRLGTGMDEFFAAVHEKVDEFRRDYQPELERRKADRDERRRLAREKELDRLMKGMSVDAPVHGVGTTNEEGDDDDASDDEYADPDDVPDAPRTDEGGLQARYEEALGEGGTLADQSFANYVRMQGAKGE